MCELASLQRQQILHHFINGMRSIHMQRHVHFLSKPTLSTDKCLHLLYVKHLERLADLQDNFACS